MGNEANVTCPNQKRTVTRLLSITTLV